MRYWSHRYGTCLDNITFYLNRFVAKKVYIWYMTMVKSNINIALDQQRLQRVNLWSNSLNYYILLLTFCYPQYVLLLLATMVISQVTRLSEEFCSERLWNSWKTISICSGSQCTTIDHLQSLFTGHKLLINPFSAGTDFRRQNMTSIDVWFWRLKSTPALKEFKYL